MLWLGTLGTAQQARAYTDCGAQVCGSAGSRLVSVSSERGALLNALLSSLTGGSIKLSVADYNALANADLELAPFLATLKTQLGAVDYQDVLTANLTLDSIFQAAASALVTQDAQLAADALGALVLATLPDETIALGDMLSLDLRGAALTHAKMNVLDLVMGSASLFNHKNALTVENVSVSGNLLGLGALVKDLDLGVTVPVPPVAGCGPVGLSFRSASMRVRLRVRLVSNSTALNVVGLNIASAGLNIGNLDLLVDVAPGQGVVSAIDAVAAAVTVHATPGVASLYLGTVSDANLLDYTTPIDPASELDYAKIATISVTLLNAQLASVNVNARSFVIADDPSPEDLAFTTPYPKKLTAQTQGDFIAGLVDDLIGNLQLTVSTASNLGDTLLNGLLGKVTDVLKGANSLLQAPLTNLTNNLVNPLLGLLGIGLGELDVQICSAPIPPNAGCPCDDGLYCTVGETCNGEGSCTGGNSPCPVPNDECQQATCSEDTDACGVEPAGCMIDGSCYPAGRGPGENSCFVCDPDVNPFDFVADPDCDPTANPGAMSDGGAGGAGGGGDLEMFGDGGTVDPNRGDAGVDINGNVDLGLAGGARCALAPAGGQRAGGSLLLLLVLGLLVERRRTRSS
ncbi:MAG: hypothetical protein QM778_25350 [Myxococcales bacterium]